MQFLSHLRVSSCTLANISSKIGFFSAFAFIFRSAQLQLWTVKARMLSETKCRCVYIQFSFRPTCLSTSPAPVLKRVDLLTPTGVTFPRTCQRNANLFLDALSFMNLETPAPWSQFRGEMLPKSGPRPVSRFRVLFFRPNHAMTERPNLIFAHLDSSRAMKRK